MKISFDLDDTIIPGIKTFKTSRQTLIQKFFRIEFIREGTIELFKKLKEGGHKVGIYTTSYRSAVRVKLLFVLNGFLPDFIINQKRNLRELRKNNIQCSKYPPAFNIDIHVDDSNGVEMEGQRYTFKTIIIDESEIDWVSKVQAEIIAK